MNCGTVFSSATENPLSVGVTTNEAVVTVELPLCEGDLKVLPPLVISNDDGSYCDLVKSYYQE